jgi:hypothetical protein
MHVPQFGFYERTLEHTGQSVHPYRDLSAVVRLTAPDEACEPVLPLFWDGDRSWRFRFSPDTIGMWKWRTQSSDPGLDGHSGRFEVIASDLRGSIRRMPGHPHHLEYQNGERFWFLGDTAWSLYVDSKEEGHNRVTAKHHIDVRASQGFNVMHSMLLSELGWINGGGAPFKDMAAEEINPLYWQEVDRRLAYLNARGLIGGLVLAWARKQRNASEPFAWDRFSNLAARTRYARYIAARYSAYAVYFIVAGEWNASARDRDYDVVRQEYVEIGRSVREADPHRRMMGIHPGTGGVYVVREFHQVAEWMDFGDYQQNYNDLNAHIRLSRPFGKPVVNAEYGYYLRDANHDGKVDKENSQTLDIIRHATWDLVMAGGYVVSGFGSTYLGGARNPGPFDVDAKQNDDWEAQISLIPAFFNSLPYWRLTPQNDLLRADVRRSEDREVEGRPASPVLTYWCLCETGSIYVVYVRGFDGPVSVTLDAPLQSYRIWQFNPRDGSSAECETGDSVLTFVYNPPDTQDWIVVLQRHTGNET